MGRERRTRAAVELDPMDAEAQRGLGHASTAIAGDLAQAEAEFDEALRLNPNSPDLLTLRRTGPAASASRRRGAAALERATSAVNPNYAAMGGCAT